jgi:hypothetical protein
MQNKPCMNKTIPLTGHLCVSVDDWEVHLALLISEDVRDISALMALDGQRIQITLSHPAGSD